MSATEIIVRSESELIRALGRIPSRTDNVSTRPYPCSGRSIVIASPIHLTRPLVLDTRHQGLTIRSSGGRQRITVADGVAAMIHSDLELITFQGLDFDTDSKDTTIFLSEGGTGNSSFVDCRFLTIGTAIDIQFGGAVNRFVNCEIGGDVSLACNISQFVDCFFSGGYDVTVSGTQLRFLGCYFASDITVTGDAIFALCDITTDVTVSGTGAVAMGTCTGMTVTSTSSARCAFTGNRGATFDTSGSSGFNTYAGNANCSITPHGSDDTAGGNT